MQYTDMQVRQLLSPSPLITLILGIKDFEIEPAFVVFAELSNIKWNGLGTSEVRMLGKGGHVFYWSGRHEGSKREQCDIYFTMARILKCKRDRSIGNTKIK